ncbi:MAG: hypothetical protein Pg6B_08880 [Candidatus Azobacteroides pseudotrichonymphae]|nr:MAG: hypothetical protein Pg6B_08880 [Candidatus Azobacteroides pseudotrichonymphae]
MKYKILLLLSLFTFSAFPKAPRSTTPSKNSHPSLYSIASKLQDEVNDLEKEEQRLIDFGKECISRVNSLLSDMEKISRKIDNGEITYWNDEIKNINNRINDLYYKDNKRVPIINNLNKRKLAVECKLEENPKLKNLIYMGHLYDKINEYNNLLDRNKYYDQVTIYNNNAKLFISKINKLPS